MNQEIIVGSWGGVEFFSIPGVIGYAISRCGKVRSLTREIKCAYGATRILIGRELKPRIRKDGYCRVSLGQDREEYVHRLVAMTFIGPVEGRIVDHIHRDPSINGVDEIRVATQGVNLLNRVSAGVTHDKGRKKGWRARIGRRHLGRYHTEAAARAAYESAMVGMNGFVPS